MSLFPENVYKINRFYCKQKKKSAGDSLPVNGESASLREKLQDQSTLSWILAATLSDFEGMRNYWNVARDAFELVRKKYEIRRKRRDIRQNPNVLSASIMSHRQ